jgi:nucleoid-associated protein YejK
MKYHYVVFCTAVGEHQDLLGIYHATQALSNKLNECKEKDFAKCFSAFSIVNGDMDNESLREFEEQILAFCDIIVPNDEAIDINVLVKKINEEASIYQKKFSGKISYSFRMDYSEDTPLKKKTKKIGNKTC